MCVNVSSVPVAVLPVSLSGNISRETKELQEATAVHILDCTLEIFKRADLKCSHHKKKEEKRKGDSRVTCS